MAYKRPNLYSVNKQEMLNNVTASSCSSDFMTSQPACGAYACTLNQVDEQNCGSTSTGQICGIMGVGPCTSTSGGGSSCTPTSSCTSNTRGSSDCGIASYKNCTTQKPSYMSSALTETDGDNEFISIDLDPYTNEIHITAGSSYPVEQLAELCRELYT